ncbi:MAG: hypothetical protein FP815_09255 [Desulfobulbaceae bacterium]|nr:hypothetical protein [Desulfobulbaceae bacterium]
MLNKNSQNDRCPVVSKLHSATSCRELGCHLFVILMLLAWSALPAVAVKQDSSPSSKEHASNKSPVVSEIDSQAAQSEHSSIINSAPIVLHDLESAGQTFISFYNNLLPVSHTKDATEICRALSAEKYVGQCVMVLNNRIEWLKSLAGITGAQFPEGTITASKDLEEAVDVEWKEVLFFGDKSQSERHHLRLYYTKVGNNWMVRKIEELN